MPGQQVIDAIVACKINVEDEEDHLEEQLKRIHKKWASR